MSRLEAIDERSAAHLLAEVERVGAALVAMLGEQLCEAVVHDFRRGEQTIVWIAGRVTERATGGAMSQIGLAMRAEGDEARDRVNYITRTRDGKVLKSSSTVLRDVDGHVFGLFCVNLDITGLAALERLLGGVLSGDEVKVLTNIHFGNNLADVARVILDEAIQERGLRSPPADTAERLEFVRSLDRRGFFGIRHSVQLLAEYLGVSRASVYNYLKDAGRDPGASSQRR